MGSGLWSGFFLQHSVSKVFLKNRISYIVSDQDCESNIYYIPNQWIVFFAHSDWLLKLGISAVHLPASFWISRANFPSFLRKKESIRCCISTRSVYTETIIYLSVSEGWWIFTSAYIHHYSIPLW